jgi:hypothetical protein
MSVTRKLISALCRKLFHKKLGKSAVKKVCQKCEIVDLKCNWHQFDILTENKQVFT